MSQHDKVQMPEDYKKSIDWIFNTYETAGVTLEDGFQKDAIQNAVGARKNDKWDQWSCSIFVEKNHIGTFIVIEDKGTQGLTGPNININKIQELINHDEGIDPEWRLARFSSRHVSGGIEHGAGQYGVGKSVYAAASQSYDYCFDSLLKDGSYVANRSEGGQIYDMAFEASEAKQKIKEWTGLDEKKSIGTRIIICNPRPEIVKSIRSNSIVKYIQENWWRCISKMEGSSGIYVNNRKVLNHQDIPYKKYEMGREVQCDSGYRVKHFGFCIGKNSDNLLKGVSYYRRGMRIGNVDVNVIPKKIEENCWGYIEVDKEWETKLAEIEDVIHYGVKKGKKNTTEYQKLKNFTNDKIRELLISWGYIKDQENEDKKLKKMMTEITSEVQNVLEDMGFEDLGKGPKKSNFEVSWKNIIFPNTDTLTVYTNDLLEYGFRLHNNYLTNQKFEYTIDIVSHNSKSLIKRIEKQTEEVLPEKFIDKHFSLRINEEVAEKYQENRIVLTVKSLKSNKEQRKELAFYYDTKKTEYNRNTVKLSLHSIDFPHKDSKRINFDEELVNISYKIDNQNNEMLRFRLNLSMHNCENSRNDKIIDIGKFEAYVKPYESVIIDKIPNIKFSQSIYKKYLEKGIVELRARLVATESNNSYEKGDKIPTEYKLRIFLNTDEKNGKEGFFESHTVKDKQDPRRSWCESNSSISKIFINSEHSAYMSISDDEVRQRQYIKEEMLKQCVLLYLAAGKYNTFSEEKHMEEMDPFELVDCVIRKIEEVYSRSLKQGVEND